MGVIEKFSYSAYLISLASPLLANKQVVGVAVKSKAFVAPEASLLSAIKGADGELFNTIHLS